MTDIDELNIFIIEKLFNHSRAVKYNDLHNGANADMYWYREGFGLFCYSSPSFEVVDYTSNLLYINALIEKLLDMHLQVIITKASDGKYVVILQSFNFGSVRFKDDTLGLALCKVVVTYLKDVEQQGIEAGKQLKEALVTLTAEELKHDKMVETFETGLMILE